jgi:hypothetical protein
VTRTQATWAGSRSTGARVLAAGDDVQQPGFLEDLGGPDGKLVVVVPDHRDHAWRVRELDGEAAGGLRVHLVVTQDQVDALALNAVLVDLRQRHPQPVLHPILVHGEGPVHANLEDVRVPVGEPSAHQAVVAQRQALVKMIEQKKNPQNPMRRFRPSAAARKQIAR